MRFPDFSEPQHRDNVISKDVHKDTFAVTKQDYFSVPSEQVTVRILPKITQMRSFQLPAEEFTNFLGKKIPAQVDIRLHEMKRSLANLRSLETEQVNGVLRDSRLKKIIERSLDGNLDNELEDKIYKITIYDSFKAKTSIRVYVIYEIDDINGKLEYYESVFLVDPFHLVIPSKHDGMSRDQYRRETYKQNCDNRICLSKYFS